MTLPTRSHHRYGASPLHALAMVGCFTLAAYAALQLRSGRPIGVAAWFVGAALVHDLVLLPVYSLADRAARGALVHEDSPDRTRSRINYLRVPAFLSELLLLVFFPLILNQSRPYHDATGLPESPYLAHWLIITAALFAVSGLILTARIGAHRRATRRPVDTDPGPTPDVEDRGRPTE